MRLKYEKNQPFGRWFYTSIILKSYLQISRKKNSTTNKPVI